MSNATKPQLDFVAPPKNRFWAFMRRGFGDRYFVRTFWRLLFPTLVWGVLISIVPDLFTQLAVSAFTVKSFDGDKAITITTTINQVINYTYEEYSTVNYLATIFIFALFPAIGNYFGHKNYEDFRQTLRFAAYISFISAAVLFICYEACAQGYIANLVYAGGIYNAKTNPGGNPLYIIQLGQNLNYSMALIGFSFVWQWIYIPALASIKNNRPLIYSAVLGIVFFLIADPIYMLVTIHPEFVHALKALPSGTITPANDGTISNTAKSVFDVQLRAAAGVGIIYTVYFFIQPIFVYLYLKFYRQIQIMWLWFKGPFVAARRRNHPQENRQLQTIENADSYYDETDYHLDGKIRNPLDDMYDGARVTKEQIEVIKNTHFFEKDLLFFDKLTIRNDLMRAVTLLSLGNIIDQTLFNAVEIIHFHFSVNFGGWLEEVYNGQTPVLVAVDHGKDLPLQSLSEYSSAQKTLLNSAARHYFKMLIYVPEQMLVFFYGIWNAFYVVPQFFVARELGMRHKEIAKRNAWICMNWSYLMGLVFMVLVFIFASFINQYAVHPSADPNAYLTFKHGKVQYWYYWEQARDMMIYWGIIQLSYTACLMAMPVVITGASKWMVFGDTMGTALFTLFTWLMYKTHFDNIAAYYYIAHMDKLFKYIVFMIIMLSGAALNSIHDVSSKNSKLIEKQWKAMNSPMSENLTSVLSEPLPKE